MRRVTAVLSAAAVAVVMVAGLSAQNTKFNGKWTRDLDKSPMPAPAAGGGGGGRGMGGAPTPFTLAVDATSLTRTPETGMQGAAPVAQVYKLDGSEQTMGTSKVKAKWDDSKTTIVVESTRDNNGTPSTTKNVYATEGDWLVITTTAPPRGGAGDPVVTKVYYKKA